MLRRTLVLVGSLVILAAPASAHATAVTGIVISKDSTHSAFVLAGRAGTATTVKASLTRVRVGDRIATSGVRLRDGTVRATSLHVSRHVRKATLRGVVLREFPRRTLVAAGGSVVSILHAKRVRALSSVGSGTARLRPGAVARIEIEFRHGAAVQTGAVIVGHAGVVEVEGRVLSVSPFVVSIGGLPVTITVPAGVPLPAGIGVGAEIELTVSVGAGNVFTLVAVEVEDEDVDEVEVEGTVLSSSPGSVVVVARGLTITFAAPPGVTLPTLPVGTRVEVKARRVNGVLVVVRLKVEDHVGDDHDHGDDGGHGGGDDHGDGGHSGHGGGGDDD